MAIRKGEQLWQLPAGRGLCLRRCTTPAGALAEVWLRARGQGTWALGGLFVGRLRGLLGSRTLSARASGYRRARARFSSRALVPCLCSWANALMYKFLSLVLLREVL